MVSWVFQGELDDFDEEDEEMQRNIGSHPLMSRVQAKLYERLSNDHDRVTLELREKEEELARIKKRREDVGVELYVQQ